MYLPVDLATSFMTLPTRCQELVVVCFLVPDMGGNRETQGVSVEGLRRYRPANSAAVLQTCMFGYGVFSPWWRRWEQLPHAAREKCHIVTIDL